MFSKFTSQQRAVAAAALREHQEKPFIDYQREEIVNRLCHDASPLARTKMLQEFAGIFPKPIDKKD